MEENTARELFFGADESPEPPALVQMPGEAPPVQASGFISIEQVRAALEIYQPQVAALQARAEALAVDSDAGNRAAVELASQAKKVARAKPDAIARNYPRRPLEECFELARSLQKNNGGNPWKPAEVAPKTHPSPPHGRHRSSARQPYPLGAPLRSRRWPGHLGLGANLARVARVHAQGLDGRL